MVMVPEYILQHALTPVFYQEISVRKPPTSFLQVYTGRQTSHSNRFTA
jgi:hypothetical protein